MYFRKVDESLKECKESNNIGFLELTENDIFFKNKFIEQKSIWKKTNFEFVDNLFIVNEFCKIFEKRLMKRIEE